MKVIIAGGRDFKPTQADWDLLDELDNQYHFTEVVSGKATGADSFSEKWANSWDVPIPVKPFPAKWDDLETQPCKIKINKWGNEYNCLAGFARNERMAQYADAIILFPGGSGTADMYERSIAHGLKVLYNANEEVF